MLKEILTRAVLAKGKVETSNVEKLELKNNPSKLVGCWIINNNFLSIVENSKVYIVGSYDIHIWYAINNDKDTAIEKITMEYKDLVEFDEKFNTDEGEFKLYCNEYPHCIGMELVDNNALVTVNKKVLVDVIGETKLMVDVNETFNEIKIDTDYM